MNNHVMLDLETLGTNRNSVILSIGAVRFDPHVISKDPIGPRFYAEFGAESLVLQQRMGMQINAATVVWWMRQNAAAKTVFQDGIGTDPVEALEGFSTFINEVPHTYIWGNGSDFDNLLLGDMYDAFSIKRPWSYSKNRCYRTMKNLYGVPGIQERTGVQHNALDDAVTQALHLQEIFNWLQSRSLGSPAKPALVKTPPPASSSQHAADTSTPSLTQ